MSKKEIKLPLTKAESAEKRLEELIANKTVLKYVMIFEGETYWRYFPQKGQIRLYPDGVEMIFKDDGEYLGMVYSERRRAIMNYDLEKDQEMQESKMREE